MGVWTEDLEAKRTTFRGVTYDSVLEADWAATLTAWRMEFVYHPGRVYLANMDTYEPDFQLDGDIILEVKGAHNQRIDKAYRLESELAIPVLIGRAGFLPSGADSTYAGAHWEGGDGVAFAVERTSSYARFRPVLPHEEVYDERLHFSAPYAYARDLNGIRMFKAVGDKIL